ncbi:MAG: mycothiol system anti-sigma-R factor [Janthinobacterium lividum]
MSAQETARQVPEQADDRPQAERCREVFDRAFEYLDGEMADLDCARLQAHLEHCVSCLEQLAEDEQVKKIIRDGCPCETAPEQLRARILVHITEMSVGNR